MTRSEAIAHIETCSGGCGLDVMPALIMPECEFCPPAANCEGCLACEYCGEFPATETIDDSDPSVGYYSEVQICEHCLRRVS